MDDKKDCCSKKKEGADLKKGIIYGLLPHTFCLAFILFSVLGATAATGFFRRWLMTPYFFQLLIGLSLLLATISAGIYLKMNQALSWEGIKRKKRYLTILYSTMVGVNLLLFLVVFPLAANLKAGGKQQAVVLGQEALATTTLRVQIPCPGHAPLIIDELRGRKGIAGVSFKLPNLFEVSYDPGVISLKEILGLEIFKAFEATEIEQ